mmetsp:Transcript_54525/g.130037  ORF Transcript_54525/g.130037 Transcript_54525/m.130037 type:complete len:256 (-) Transcript_54525:1084-1851(-)
MARFNTKSRPSPSSLSFSLERTESALTGSNSCPPTMAMMAGRFRPPSVSLEKLLLHIATAAIKIFLSPTGIDEKVMKPTRRPSFLAFLMKASASASMSSSAGSFPRRRKMKSVGVMPLLIMASALLPRTMGLIGTTWGTPWRWSSAYCLNWSSTARGQGDKPRRILILFSVGPPSGMSSMICWSPALKPSPPISSRHGPSIWSRMVSAVIRCSSSCAGCKKKPTILICSASDNIMAMWVTVKPKTTNSGFSSHAQ